MTLLRDNFGLNWRPINFKTKLKPEMYYEKFITKV